MYNILSLTISVLLTSLSVHHVVSTDTMTIMSVWYGNVYARACLDVPPGISCGWHIQFYFDPVVTSLTVYDGTTVASSGHYFISKNKHYNKDIRYFSQLCLSFTGTNPSITYPRSANITAKFVCSCPSENCGDREYAFESSAPSTNETTSSSTHLSTSSESTTIRPTSSSTSTELPLSTTTVSLPTDESTTSQVSTTSVANVSADFWNVSTTTHTLPMVSNGRRRQFMLWKRDHVSRNVNYKYNRVNDLMDCIQWCSYFDNCTGFTIYFQHCWSIINEPVSSRRYYKDCDIWIRVD